MSKRVRQYMGLLAAVVAYYLIHEGAHLAYALATGTFRQIRFLGLGIQIDVYAEKMTDLELGLFCMVGALATMTGAWLLTGLAEKISKAESKVFRACMYYITLALLFLDPVYLGLLCSFFGGGDMNGIALLFPEAAVRIFFCCLLTLNIVLFRKWVLSFYIRSFQEGET